MPASEGLTEGVMYYTATWNRYLTDEEIKLYSTYLYQPTEIKKRPTMFNKLFKKKDKPLTITVPEEYTCNSFGRTFIQIDIERDKGDYQFNDFKSYPEDLFRVIKDKLDRKNRCIKDLQKEVDELNKKLFEAKPAYKIRVDECPETDNARFVLGVKRDTYYRDYYGFATRKEAEDFYKEEFAK